MQMKTKKRGIEMKIRYAKYIYKTQKKIMKEFQVKKQYKKTHKGYTTSFSTLGGGSNAINCLKISTISSSISTKISKIP